MAKQKIAGESFAAEQVRNIWAFLQREAPDVGVDLFLNGRCALRYLPDELGQDKEDWLLRKRRTVLYFGLSTQALGEKLQQDGSLLETRYGCSQREMTLVAGGVPIFQPKGGLLGAISITGRSPQEDHELALACLQAAKTARDINQGSSMEERIEEMIPLLLEVAEDLQVLIAIPSHRDESSKTSEAPFGQGIAQAFAYLSQRSQALGFSTRSVAHQVLEISTGPGEDYVGVLCHIDTVEEIERALWMSDPYLLDRRDGFFYGRGVNDNKGPLLAILHTLAYLKREKRLGALPVRLIVGGAEETSWEGITAYFKENPQPRWGFSPDGDFPIVQEEKGMIEGQADFFFPWFSEDIRLEGAGREGFILEELTLRSFDATTGESQEEIFKGTRALSRHPERGESAWQVLDQRRRDGALGTTLKAEGQRILQEVGECIVTLERLFGATKDSVASQHTAALTKIWYEKGHLTVGLDVRFGHPLDQVKVCSIIEKALAPWRGIWTTHKERALLYVPENDPLIRCLKEAYEAVTHEPAKLLCKGGASYARALTHGVAFGPTFPKEVPRSHLANECQSISSLARAMAIWSLALEKLTDPINL
ncbi:Acetylornithine deacetylase/Succinyl-diaminopimelate desuccinylase [Clostridiaceae bacterium JG1575]|nr:Acetylornithine deacetylase/Succinyl-diaminopimelate desuccinylase [Clostridiaceae bacterium JG1575]